MGFVPKVQAGILSGDFGVGLGAPAAGTSAGNESFQSWVPYHSEFSEVSCYLATWVLSRQQSFSGFPKSEIVAGAGTSSQSDSDGLPIQKDLEQQLRRIDNALDCQAGSTGAGSSAPERPPIPQSGLTAEADLAVAQTVALLEIENKSLSVTKHLSGLFRPPRPSSLA
jgi:hypothetical protein